MTPPRISPPSSSFAVALLDEFVRLGVRHIVLSPGSRSQALALAAVEFERASLLELHVRIDERSAGFLALGLAVETATPVLVVTTSGTAVANLHPAVLEAHHAGVPLVLLTADRPEALRGIGANQTTQQPGIFGDAVRAEWDVPAPVGDPGELPGAARLAREAFAAAARGPVHLNLAFTEPLSGAVELPDTDADWTEQSAAADPSAALDIHPAPATIVVAGQGAGERAEEVARELGAPLLAEVASGAHFGPNLVVAYRELLGTANFGDRVSRVIVFGRPTLSREIPALIQRQGVETILVRSAAAEDYNPGHRVATIADAVRVVGEPDTSVAARSWLGRWVSASRSILERGADEVEIPTDRSSAGAHAKRELEAVRAPVTRRSLVEAVWRATWPHDRLVLGASRLIREADRVVPGKKIPVHANRGLAGIDGTISTAVGIALASQAAASTGEAGAGQRGGSRRAATGTTRVLLGDLAALHDAGGLLFGAGERRPRLQVIVGNDVGGTIFDGLEVAQVASAEAIDRVMLTPQSVSFESLAAAYGWDYVRAETRGELDQVLSTSGGCTLIEVPLPR